MDLFLQNDLLLLAVGLLPAAAVVIPLLLAKKLFKKFSFVLLTLTVCGGIAYCGTVGAMNLADDLNAVTYEEEDTPKAIRYLDQDDFIAAFSGFVLEEQYASAERILSDYSDLYGWDEDCSLMNAQLSYATGDYARALGVYKKLYGKDLPDEGVVAEKIVRYQMAGGASVMENVGEASTKLANADLIEAQVLLDGKAAEILDETLSEVKDVEIYQKAALFAKRIETLYNRVTDKGEMDEVELSNLTEEIKDVEGKKSLNKLSVWRVARLKLNLLNRDFDQVVNDLDEYASCEEYVISLELYLNDHVTGKSLEKALNIEKIEGSEAVLDQLEIIAENDALEDEELREVNSQIDRLEAYNRSELLYFIENELLKVVEDRDYARSSSKIYLSLASLSGSIDRTLGQNEYFSQALVAAGNSDDSAYAEAMNQLANTISGEGDEDDVLEVDKWANQAIQNSSFIPGSGEIVRVPEKQEELTENLQDYSIKASAAITISSINTTHFNEIVAKIQVSDEFMTEKELANLLILHDCALEITDFTVEKVDFETANVILCCDNSGSMSGSIGALQNAVNKFLDSSTEDEILGFYTFDDRILQSLPLGSSMESIREAVNNMNDMGSTNIYGTIETILSSAPTDLKANNVLIVMTDGQDNSTYNVEEVVKNIGHLATTKGYIVYALGMGSGIEPGQLRGIVEATGGQFLYSPTDQQLETLYDFIRGQMKNQYLVTYKTIDTLTMQDRPLQIGLSDQDVQTTKYYSISESDEETAYLPFDYDVSVYGLKTRLICQQKNVTDIDVIGTGFRSTDSMYITLKYDRTYRLRATYINETTFRISVPADIALGVYDMEVYLNNRYAVYEDELTVTDGKIMEVKFGKYSFKAMKIEESDDGIYMLGNVVMNGWLTFNGSVNLMGDIDGVSMELIDYSGSYVSYADSTSATGYAKFLKDLGIPQVIPSLGSLTIYNAVENYSNYPTDPHTLPVLKLFDFFRFNTPILRLYPDRMTLEIKSGAADLPFQDLLFSSVNNSTSPFEFNFECTGTISGENITLKGSASADYSEGDATFLAKFLDTTASLSKTVAKVEFDTADGSVGLEFNIKIPYFPVETYVGCGLQWKNMALDGVQLHLDRDFTKMAGPVPITFSDFSLGFTGMASTTLNASNETVSDLTLVGKMDISACKVSAVVPKLKKYVGDASLLKVPQATFTCALKHFSVGATAKLTMLDCVELLEAKVMLGNHNFSSPMLGLDQTNVSGIYVSLAKGFSWDAHNLMVSIKGTGELVINNRFVGASYTGNADLEMNWWIFEKSVHKSGGALVGFYTDYSGNTQFTVRASELSNGKRKGAIFYITDTGKMDYDLSYKFN